MIKCTGLNCPMQAGKVDPATCKATGTCKWATKPLTNAERIRAMSDEELGFLLVSWRWPAMADILIRGMEMPNNVFDCPLNSFGICNLAQDETHCDCIGDSRPEWCPFIPLLEGHGRLIDADAIVKTICNSCDGQCEVVQCDCLNCKADCRCDIVKEISDAPTIVPAEGGEADGN